ncbi:hypothetical protein QYE76_011096 [Lolium multiflorum]|uniref:Retrotransposon gag domain-containing protein n=1 Tax=Lolium multiflorum TaxID=4521 RepID=A0AAD8X5A7_LOLMU|nr:hypothetical protein QYE76_011096 [Lolium multiflorum]
MVPKRRTIGYSKPYPNEYELIPLPPKYRLPDFSKFNGSDGSSSIEHSLTGSAFGWYTSLPPDSIRTWKQLEEQFHMQYHSEASEAGIADLAQVRQKRGETVSEYVQRFRTVRNRCYSARVTEKEAVELAVVGLASSIKDVASQADYPSLAHMVQKLSVYEQRHPDVYQDKFKRAVVLVEADEDEGSAGDQEVAVAEWTRGASPVSCKWVKPQGPPRGFDFDVTKAEQIFDLLLKEKQLKVPEGHKIPTVQELNGKPYCKWHNTFTHATNDCRVWRQQVQMAIEQGRLIFSQYAMKVDTHPFPAVNMVECTYPGGCQPGFSFNINMVGPGHHSGMSRLPTIGNCPECRQKKKDAANVSVFKRLGPLPPRNKHAESSRVEDLEDLEDDDEEEEDKYHRPRWCPDGLSRSQKRRVQRLRGLEEAERLYLHTLRKARPDLAAKIQRTLDEEGRPQRKEWRPRQKKADDETSAGTNMVFILPAEFCAPGLDEAPVAQLDCGPRPVIFEKPRERSYRHLKALYLRGYINGQPVNKMLVDTGAAVNIMPYSMLRRLGRSSSDLIKTNVTLSDFNGQASDAQGVLNVDLTVGRKTIPTTFFIVDSKSTYAVLLGRDWIHANCCIPSTMHQCLIQWDGDEVEVVHADDSAEISTAGMNVWETTGQEPLSGINLDDCERIDVTKDGVRLVLSTGLTV